jgi:hypothetical protein
MYLSIPALQNQEYRVASHNCGKITNGSRTTLQSDKPATLQNDKREEHSYQCGSSCS